MSVSFRSLDASIDETGPRAPLFLEGARQVVAMTWSRRQPSRLASDRLPDLVAAIFELTSSAKLIGPLRSIGDIALHGLQTDRRRPIDGHRAAAR